MAIDAASNSIQANMTCGGRNRLGSTMVWRHLWTRAQYSLSVVAVKLSGIKSALNPYSKIRLMTLTRLNGEDLTRIIGHYQKRRSLIVPPHPDSSNSLESFFYSQIAPTILPRFSRLVKNFKQQLIENFCGTIQRCLL